jgi:hypothetical protein
MGSRLGFERGTQRVHGSSESGVDGLARDVERLGDLLRRQVHEVAQDDDRAVVGREMLEPAAQLVTIATPKTSPTRGSAETGIWLSGTHRGMRLASA